MVFLCAKMRCALYAQSLVRESQDILKRIGLEAELQEAQCSQAELSAPLRRRDNQLNTLTNEVREAKEHRRFDKEHISKLGQRIHHFSDKIDLQRRRLRYKISPAFKFTAPASTFRSQARECGIWGGLFPAKCLPLVVGGSRW